MYINYTQPRLKDQYPTEVFQRKEHQITFKLSEYLFKKFRWQKKIRLPQAYLAKIFNCETKTIYRAIKYLEDNNVLRVLRDAKQINIYYLSPTYRSLDVFNSCMIYFKNVMIFSVSLLASQPDVRLNINNGSYLNLSISNIQKVMPPKKVLKKKRVVMNVVEWGKAIQSLNERLPLTDHGIAKLGAYPPEAINFAAARIPMVYKAHDPFAYFTRLCEDFCTLKNIAPDWSQYKSIQEAYSISSFDMLFVDEVKLQELRDEESKVSQQNIQKREVREPIAQEKPFVRPTRGPQSVWKPTDIRDQKFTVIGKLSYCDGDATAQDWRQKEPNYGEYEKILIEGFLKQADELLKS